MGRKKFSETALQEAIGKAKAEGKSIAHEVMKLFETMEQFPKPKKKIAEVEVEAKEE